MHFFTVYSYCLVCLDNNVHCLSLFGENTFYIYFFGKSYTACYKYISSLFLCDKFLHLCTLCFNLILLGTNTYLFNTFSAQGKNKEEEKTIQNLDNFFLYPF